MSSQGCYPDKAPRVNELLDDLSHHLRRETLDFFENHADTRTATLDELIAHITHRVPQETAASLRQKLQHRHLPKLEDGGWLDYDARREIIHYHGHDHADQWLGDVQAIFTP